MQRPEGVIGIVLAGGKSSRMGGADKSLLPLGGRPLLARVIERLRPQVAEIVLNANDDPARFAVFGLPHVPDRLAGQMGPLAGIHDGLAWAEANSPESRLVITVAADTPFFPTDLVSRLCAATDKTNPKLVVARSESGVHPVFGALAGVARTASGGLARPRRAQGPRFRHGASGEGGDVPAREDRGEGGRSLLQYQPA
jgi:molybdenum cofactor guanylyltransferase